jgi:uncharacterized membrane protein YdjX (TVP38/TMEM64 family)
MPKKYFSRKWMFVLFILIMVTAGYIYQPSWGKQILQFFSEDSMGQLASYIRSFGWWAPLVSVGLMVMQAVAAPLPSFLLAAANGIVFGVFWGSVISWVGGMAGAAVNFYLARWLGYKFVTKAAGRTNVLKKVNEFSGEHGFFLILLARLIPLISFDFISLLAGLSRIRGMAFLIATGIGQIPGTVLYVMVGHDLANIQTYENRLILTSILLVILVILGKWWTTWRKG